MSYREISAVLTMPVGSIGPTRARGLARLRAGLRRSQLRLARTGRGPHGLKSPGPVRRGTGPPHGHGANTALPPATTSASSGQCRRSTVLKLLLLIQSMPSGV